MPTVHILFLLIISAFDISEKRIPNFLLALLVTASLIMKLVFSPGGLPSDFFSAALFFLLFFSVRLLTRGLGMGDVKLAAVLGFSAGFYRAVVSLIVACIAGIVLYPIIFFKNKGKVRIPLAPFIAAGYIVSELLYGRFFLCA